MKRISYLIAMILFSTAGFAQTHFVLAYTGNGQDHMNIYVVTATIGGVDLQAGDEIAAFDGSICCGLAVLTQPIVITNSGTFAAVAASRADDGQANGYTVGHAITYKFWDSSKSQELSGITAEYLDLSGNTITAPTYTINGSAIVKLSVAAPANHAPVANAGPDQSPNENTLVTLDGSASSDPDGNPLTYTWTAPAGITLSSTTVAKPTFTAPEVTTDTPYTFSLVVNDGTVDSPADQVIITVKNVNKVPVANAGPDQSVNEGATVTLDGTASSDPDGSALTYNWTAPAGITLSSATASKPTFTAPEVTINTNYTFSLVVNDGTANSTADQVVITVNQVNKPPVANAGPDQSPNENTLVTLDGSASSDPDGNPLTYTWTAPAGITLSSTTVAKPTFTAPEVTTDTPYTFSLVVNDGTVDSPADQVVITVKNVNKVPVANAGPDQSVNEGATVTLDGTASSDPDGSALTYNWTAPAGITLSSATASKPTFTAPEVTINTNYTFSLVVNDGTANSTADQVVITVNQVNKPPVANAGPDGTVTERKVYQLDGSLSSDPDNNTLTYKWTAPVGITLNSTTAIKPTFTAPVVASSTTYTFSLIVNDGALDSPADQVVITVVPNLPPTANAGPDQTVAQGQSVTLNGSLSSDPENDPLTYAWTAPAGITLSNSTSVNPGFVAPLVSADTDYSFKLKVNDGELDSPEDEVIIHVLHNQAPVANAGADFSVDEGSNVSLDGSASSDPEGSSLTYKWTAPAGITLSSTTVAKPSFTAPEVSQDTQFTFSLVVNDGVNNSPADQVIVTVKQVNKSPVANAGPDQTINEGTLVTLDGSGSSDPDGDALTYSWTAPDGITLSSVSAAKPTFTTPDVTTDTAYSFKLTVSDGAIISSADYVVITVKKVNQLPVANAGADQAVNEGSITTLDGSGSSDPDNDPLTYQWTAPSGITLSSATVAKPTFTAPEVQTDTAFKFTLVVNDGTGNSPADEVIVTVKQVNKAPVANAGTDQSVNENSLFTLDGSASSDPDGDVITYKWTAPAGITLSSTTVAKPTFTAPNVSANTTYTFSLVVNDGKLDSPADQVVITVKQENKAPTANAGPDQIVNEGAPVMLDGSASSDPDSDPLTYSWTAPAGITLSSATTAKPTFTAPKVNSDTDFTFSLTVNDGTINSTPDQVVITVKNVDHSPYVKDSIKNVSVDKKAPEMKIDLTTVFADDDTGDVLTYSVSQNTNNLVVVPSITGSVLTLTFSTDNVGSSGLSITATSNGKSAKSSFKVDVNIPSGISPIMDDATIQIYPNPTQGEFYLKFDRDPKVGTWATVYNLTGRAIVKKMITSKTEEINLKGNSPGLYFIRIEQQSPKTFKVVLK